MTGKKTTETGPIGTSGDTPPERETAVGAAPGTTSSEARVGLQNATGADLAHPPGKTPEHDPASAKAEEKKPEDESEDEPKGFLEGALDAAENDQLPDNKWSRTLKAYDKEAKRLGLEGPITNGIRTIFALMAMYAHVGDLVPGSY